MKIIFAIIAIGTAIAANAQLVKIATVVENSAAAAPQQNSARSDIQGGFVAWKVSPRMDAKERYDAFLRAKGVDPNRIGAAMVVNGRMVVPTIEEEYAPRYSKFAGLNPKLSGTPNFPYRPVWWYVTGRPNILARSNKHLYTTH
jgi:hypothetical protein